MEAEAAGGATRGGEDGRGRGAPRRDEQKRATSRCRRRRRVASYAAAARRPAERAAAADTSTRTSSNSSHVGGGTAAKASGAVSTPAYNLVRVCPAPTSAAAFDGGVPSEFTFDAAFGASASQRALYEEVSPAIASVLNGQYVCVMAYGQTGSGKTYTMHGGAADGERGVVHHAVEELLTEAASLEAERRRRGGEAEELRITFEASMLEIYNEKIFDLLHDAKGGAADSLDVRVAADGSVSVPRLSLRPVRSAEEVATLLAEGSKRRHTHGTLMNACSSRSHLVLTINVRTTCRTDSSSLEGRLHLVDLAGSERVGKSGVVGEQLKEAQHINKSLSSLEQVMLALHAQRQQQQHGVPRINGALARRRRRRRSPRACPTGTRSSPCSSPTPSAPRGSCGTIMVMNAARWRPLSPRLRTLKFGERCQAVCPDRCAAPRREAGARGRARQRRWQSPRRPRRSARTDSRWSSWRHARRPRSRTNARGWQSGALTRCRSA